MIDKNAITIEEHRVFLEEYENSPRLDFLFIEDESSEVIGGVNIVSTKLGLELGKYVGVSKYLGQGIAKAGTQSFLSFLANSGAAGLHIISRTRSSNYRNIGLNQSLGFTIKSDLNDAYVLMEKLL